MICIDNKNFKQLTIGKEYDVIPWLAIGEGISTETKVKIDGFYDLNNNQGQKFPTIFPISIFVEKSKYRNDKIEELGI